jgi:hypothetical protein
MDKNSKDKENIVKFDKNFMLQSPVEILPTKVVKDIEKINTGNITLSRSKVYYIDNGKEIAFEEIPHTKNDRLGLHYFIKLVRSSGKKKRFELTKYKLVKDVKRIKKGINPNHYDSMVKMLLRWYSVSMLIKDYKRYDSDKKEVVIADAIFRVLSGIEISDKKVVFYIAEPFSQFIKQQNYLKNIDYDKLAEIDRKSEFASQFFLFCENVKQYNKLKIALGNLQKRLGIREMYKDKKPANFVKDLKQVASKVSKKTHLKIELEFFKKEHKGTRPVYHSVEIRLKEEFPEVKDQFSYLKEALEEEVWNYYYINKAINVLISTAKNYDYSMSNLVSAMRHCFFNRVRVDTMTMEKRGAIRNPVGHIIKSVEKGRIF